MAWIDELDSGCRLELKGISYSRVVEWSLSLRGGCYDGEHGVLGMDRRELRQVGEVVLELRKKRGTQIEVSLLLLHRTEMEA